LALWGARLRVGLRFGERWSRATLARAVLIGLVPLLYALGLLRFGVILLVAFLVEAFDPAYVAMQRGVLALVVGEDERALARGGALLQSATQATRLVGPAIGGLLIAALGAPNVLWVDASTYLFSAVVLGMVLPAAAGRITELEAAGLPANHEQTTNTPAALARINTETR
jgi:predicted MFS family arabinose efflux permease